MKQELKTVYFISGLGADHRAFAYLDLSFCQPVFLPWQRPLQGDSMSEYAKRLSTLITDPSPVIVGLSLGGMMAVEISKHIPVEKIILISSASNLREIPFYLKLLKWIPLHRWIGIERVKKLNYSAYKLMGIHRREDKVLFTRMFSEADNIFTAWAIDQIVSWKNKDVPPNMIHIHGTSDILLPYRFMKADYTIKGGKHLMPMIQPDVISALLKKLIS